MASLESKESRAYSDRGFEIIELLVRKAPLLDWSAGNCSYTDDERKAIGGAQRCFKEISDSVAQEQDGDYLAFHPDILNSLDRITAERGLTLLADDGWQHAETLPDDWRLKLSTYLKAWICNLNPLILLDVVELLARVGLREEAIRTLGVFQHLPLHAQENHLYGPSTSSTVESILQAARSLE